jgi:hypothetical protein
MTARQARSLARYFETMVFTTKAAGQNHRHLAHGVADSEWRIYRNSQPCGSVLHKLHSRSREVAKSFRYLDQSDRRALFGSEGPLLAQSGTSVGGLSQRRATLGLRRKFELRLRVRQRRTRSDGVDEVRLAPRSERPLPPRSPQTVAHDAAFPRDIPDILLTFLFLRQPASVASPLLRRAVSCLF